MDKLRLIKINDSNYKYVCVINEKCNYLQSLCDDLGVSLITTSKFYFPKKNIFDYKNNKKITANIFEDLIYQKTGLRICNYNEDIVKKYEGLFQELGFVKDDNLTLKAKILIKIINAEKNKIDDLEEIIE